MFGFVPHARREIVSKKRVKWAAPGDVNAFFGLMLDNIADLVLTVSLLSGVFGFPAAFALRYMVPGTAVGVLVGDLLFFWMALSLAKRTGRSDITAMPLGLDTPSTFGMVFFVLGPAFTAASRTMSVEEAAVYTWHIGICSIFLSGIFKLICAAGSSWIRNALPRAGLLGSLAAIALVLISFLPLVEILHYPVVGFVALAIILTSLVARVRLPFGMPGALGAVLVAGAVYYAMKGVGLLEAEPNQLDPFAGLWPHEWTAALSFQWMGAMGDSLKYLPVVIPFALGTVVGGIDCTESAAAAGDEFHTGKVVGVEAIATLAASICGGVIQTTPYIGHPAYKAMGGRSAYTLATALFVGGAGLLGYFGFLYVLIPKATVFPILVFIGLEITAQSFHATPRRHFPAVAFACVPALASLAMIYLGRPEISAVAEKFYGKELEILRVLSNGFIITSLIWASALAAIIDRRMFAAAVLLTLGGLASLFGIVHSPLVGGAMFWPGSLDESVRHIPYEYAAAYIAAAVVIALIGMAGKPTDEVDREP